MRTRPSAIGARPVPRARGQGLRREPIAPWPRAGGLIETATLVAVTLTDFGVLRILGGADYLQAFNANGLQALARLSLSAHFDVYNVGLVLARLRRTAFCHLWFKSCFVPRTLAAWGLIASFLMGACAFIISPDLARIVPVDFYGTPIFLFELTMGFWLLLRGWSRSVVAPDRGEELA